MIQVHQKTMKNNIIIIVICYWDDDVNLGWDDAVTIGTVSKQTSTDTYRYGHHAVPIQMMVTAAKTTTIPNPKLFVSHLIFI